MVVGYFARETWYDCGTFQGRKTNHQVHEKNNNESLGTMCNG